MKLRKKDQKTTICFEKKNDIRDDKQRQENDQKTTISFDKKNDKKNKKKNDEKTTKKRSFLTLKTTETATKR